MITALFSVLALVLGAIVGFLVGYRRGRRARLAEIASSSLQRATASARAAFGHIEEVNKYRTPELSRASSPPAQTPETRELG